MDSETYKLVFKGEIQEGGDVSKVKSRLASLLKTDDIRIEKLFSNPSSVLKRGLTIQKALKYKQAIEKTGAICHILTETTEKKTAQELSSTMAAGAAAPSRIPQNTVLYQSEIPHQELGIYGYIVLPLWKAKDVVEAVFNTVLGMIWDELIGKKQEYNHLAQIIAFLVFSALSLVVFYLPEFWENVVLWGLVSIWCVDYLLARRDFFQAKQHETISIESQTSNQIIWSQQASKGDVNTIRFRPEEVTRISLAPSYRLGGAFHENVGRVWLTHLELEDSGYLLDKQEDVNRAIEKAMKLAGYFNVPVEFEESKTESPIGPGRGHEPSSEESTSDEILFRPGNVVYRRSPDKIEIYSAWSRENVAAFLGAVLHISGFLLFLLVMAGIMARYGELLSWFIGPHLGLESTTMRLNLTVSGLLSIFKPKVGLFDIAQLVFIVGIMVYQGLRMSRPKHISISKGRMELSVGNKRIAALKTDEIEHPHFFQYPDPLLLVVDRNHAMLIDGLQSTNEYVGTKRAIEQAIRELRS